MLAVGEQKRAKVSKPIISRGYIPPNRQPSKYDLKMNNLSISSFKFIKKPANDTFATDLLQGPDKQIESVFPNVVSDGVSSQSNLRYGSNSAIPTQSKFGKLMSTNKIATKLKSSNPAAFLATMKDRLEQIRSSGLQAETVLLPPDSKVCDLKNFSLRLDLLFSRRFRRKSRLLQWLVFFSSVQRPLFVH